MLEISLNTDLVFQQKTRTGWFPDATNMLTHQLDDGPPSYTMEVQWCRGL